ncbi:hypothetical protein MFIFM68171_06697 [Madurella fahalii]|uniref:Uncharacterized protein n=1 Tax=Madurella fahalii TaxID=1157608 RepID=A0ABQ0GFE4_9PEZI
MDWTRDDRLVSDKDLATIFKYEPKTTTVAHNLGRDEVSGTLLSRRMYCHLLTCSPLKTLLISTLEDHEWPRWLSERCPRLDGSASGLVIILARRSGEPPLKGLKMSRRRVEEWRKGLDDLEPARMRPERAMTLTKFNDMAAPTGSGISTAGSRHALRTLPFSMATFQSITERFHTHGDIARTVSRADVASYSSTPVCMGEYLAYVTNCRTTNAWNMDLALTCTYFPHCALTFAIVFGCTVSVEEEILNRLSSISTVEATHPLVMPGIIAELERLRHINAVEATIDELEARIFELDFKPSNMDELASAEAGKKNNERRNAWLDTAYMSNQLVNWNTQLARMAACAVSLDNTVFKQKQDPTSQAKELQGVKVYGMTWRQNQVLNAAAN